MPNVGLLIFGAFLALIVLSLVFSALQAKWRREALAQQASQLGLAFSPDGAGALDGGLRALPLFGHGRGQSAGNLIHGQLEGVEVRLFDYQYTTGSGKSSHTHRQSVAAFGLARVALPAFQMQPETFLHALAALVGYNDIDFESHPTFSRRYTLRGPDEAAIRELFDDKVLECFEAHPGWCVEANGRWLVIYRGGRLRKPAEIPAFLDETFRLFGVFGIA